MTNKKIVITRPNEQGLLFAKQVGGDAGDFLFEPLIEINHLNIDLPDFDMYDGFIVTSGHAKDIIPKGMTCYSIGDYAPTASELADKINQQNEKLRLLYVRGADISFDMVGALKNHQIDEIIVYEAVSSDSFSNEIIHSFKNNEIGEVVFFSKRTAEIFAKLAIKHDILDNMGDIKALCISNSMVECLNPVFGDNIEVSSKPDALAMAQMVNIKKGAKK